MMTTQSAFCLPLARPALFGAVVATAILLGVPQGLAAQTLARDSSPDRSAPTAPDSSESTPEDGEDTSESDPVAANRPDEKAHDTTFDESHRRELYRKGRLHFQSALWRTALLPGLGNFYAEQYLLGGLNASLMGFTAVLIPYGLVTSQPGFAWAGVGVAGAAYTSGIITSAIGVRRYNRRLKRRLRLAETQPNPFDIPQAPSLSLTFRF